MVADKVRVTAKRAIAGEEPKPHCNIPEGPPQGATRPVRALKFGGVGWPFSFWIAMANH